MEHVEREGCAVETSVVGALIGSYVQRWETGRSRAYIEGVDPLDHLAERTGIRPRTLENYIARKPKPPTLALSVADRIVAGGLGLPEAFHDGTITVIPNPNARPEVRASCCGGSSSTPGDSLLGVA